MKIGQPNDHSVAITQNSQSAAAKVSPEAANAVRNERKTPGVDVKVSSLARGLEKAGASEPAVDIDKVNAIRQQIADKTYSVNPEAIADKMLGNAREMLQRASS
jgi:negative regulator of flagellin synthesis FlgM